MLMENSENPKKNKHLTLEDRRTIEDCLQKQMPFKAIAKLIGKDPTTVSYEVKNHRVEHRNGNTSHEEPCPQLLKAPFVCNGCKRRYCCRYVMYYYRASEAYQSYRNTLSSSREGIPLNKSEFYEVDRIISSGLKKGQHIYHIMANSPSITCSKSTVYRHFSKGYYSASVLDLPRKVKFKPRKAPHPEYVPKGVKVGRSYDDFLIFLDEHHLESHVELDTLIGRIGGKVILTIHFTSCNFMAAVLLPNKTAAEAAKAFSSLKNKIRNAGLSASSLMVALLADNGVEFSDVSSLENDPSGSKEIPMFFCDPMRSSQKPFIEKNHTLFRDIVPRGSSFDDFDQTTVNLIFSHVNSVSRSIYFGKTPFELFSFLYGDSVPGLFGISKIPPQDVVQSPLLLKGLADLKKNI